MLMLVIRYVSNQIYFFNHPCITCTKLKHAILEHLNFWSVCQFTSILMFIIQIKKHNFSVASSVPAHCRRLSPITQERHHYLQLSTSPCHLTPSHPCFLTSISLRLIGDLVSYLTLWESAPKMQLILLM